MLRERCVYTQGRNGLDGMKGEKGLKGEGGPKVRFIIVLPSSIM